MTRAESLLLIAALTIHLATGWAGWGQTDPQNPRIDDDLPYYSPTITAAELIRARGYHVEKYYLITPDDYQLELVHGTNPLANNSDAHVRRLPILFIHGVQQTGVSWLLSSARVEPRLYDQEHEPGSMDVEQLYELVKDDPARRSLPFLAMNFGHDVWILERRGFMAGSRRKVGRRERTLVDAVIEMSSTYLGGGFSPHFDLNPGRPYRTPIETLLPALINSSQLNVTDKPQLDLLALSQASLKQVLKTLSKLPQQLADLGDLGRQFIDTFDADFWNYSLDEQVEFDFPETIDFVLAKTGTKRLHVVGFSAGAAIALLHLASEPETAEKSTRDYRRALHELTINCPPLTIHTSDPFL